MQKVKAAALAPAEPSAADRSVATEAAKRILQAQAELSQQNVALNDPPAADADYWLEQAKTLSEQLAGNRSTKARGRSIRLSLALPAIKGLKWNSAALRLPKFMQKRSKVISGFYQQAVQPQDRPLLLTA